jgi:hypothetical protein
VDPPEGFEVFASIQDSRDVGNTRHQFGEILSNNPFLPPPVQPSALSKAFIQMPFPSNLESTAKA